MIKLFKRKKKEPEEMSKVDGFYVDTNTTGEQSKTVWSEWIMTPDGLINVRTKDSKPSFPPDRIEIH